MKPTWKTLAKIGLTVVVPGFGIAWLLHQLVKDADERTKFREYVRKTYGDGSRYVDPTS